MNLTFVSNSIELLHNADIARVEEAIAPNQRGWVAFDGTYWYAEQYVNDQDGTRDDAVRQEAIAPGMMVQVMGRRGNTLLVTRLTRTIRQPLSNGLQTSALTPAFYPQWLQTIDSIVTYLFS